MSYVSRPAQPARKRSFYNSKDSPPQAQPAQLRSNQVTTSINISRADWLPTPVPQPHRYSPTLEWMRTRRKSIAILLSLFVFWRYWTATSPTSSIPTRLASNHALDFDEASSATEISHEALPVIHPTPIPVLRKPRPPPTTPDPNEKYLSYLPHSGFHNQRISLENALSLSLLLNRTLLLPPVWLGTAIPYITYSKMYDRLRAASKVGLETCKDEKGLSRECVGYWDWTMVGWETFVDLKPFEEAGGKVVDWWSFGEDWITQNLGVKRDRSLTTSYKSIQKILSTQGPLMQNGDVFEVWDEKLYQFRISSVAPATLSPTSSMNPTDKFYIYNKYLDVLPLSSLRETSEPFRLLALGTLFGTTRLHFFPHSSDEYKARSIARRTMVFSNPGLKNVADEVANILREFAKEKNTKDDGYWAVHLRVGDGKFRDYKEKNCLKVFRELVTEGMGMSNATVDEMVDRWKRGDYGERLPPEGKSGRPFERLKRLIYREPPPTLPLKLACKSLPHVASHLQPFNSPLFIATDSPTLDDPILNLFTASFPCVFTLSDFGKLLSYREVTEGWFVEKDGVALGPMMPPFLDAMIAARGKAIAGTPESTFSKFATDVLWRVEQGMDIVERG